MPKFFWESAVETSVVSQVGFKKILIKPGPAISNFSAISDS